MNPVQQKAHTTVTATLARGIENIADEVGVRLGQMERRVLAAEDHARQQVGEERTHRLKLADEQRAYVDAAIQKESTYRRENDNLQVLRLDALEAARRIGFFGRLRWLLLGSRDVETDSTGSKG